VGTEERTIDRAMKRLLGGIVNLLLVCGGLFLGLVVIEEIIPYYWKGQAGALYKFGEAFEHDPTLGWVNRLGYHKTVKPPDSLQPSGILPQFQGVAR
jgi:hypothetical protein